LGSLASLDCILLKPLLKKSPTTILCGQIAHFTSIQQESAADMTIKKSFCSPPGSSLATKSGCTCPILDNHGGAGAYGAKHLFFIDYLCPLHGIEASQSAHCQAAKQC
jgi:hypothetical protein